MVVWSTDQPKIWFTVIVDKLFKIKKKACRPLDNLILHIRETTLALDPSYTTAQDLLPGNHARPPTKQAI